MLTGQLGRVGADVAGCDDPQLREPKRIHPGHDIGTPQEPLNHWPGDRTTSMLRLDGPAVGGAVAQCDDVDLVRVRSLAVMSTRIIDTERAGLTGRGHTHGLISSKESAVDDLSTKLADEVLHPPLEQLAHGLPIVRVLRLEPREETLSRLRVLNGVVRIAAGRLERQPECEDWIEQLQTAVLLAQEVRVDQAIDGSIDLGRGVVAPQRAGDFRSGRALSLRDAAKDRFNGVAQSVTSGALVSERRIEQVRALLPHGGSALNQLVPECLVNEVRRHRPLACAGQLTGPRGDGLRIEGPATREPVQARRGVRLGIELSSPQTRVARSCEASSANGSRSSCSNSPPYASLS